ncbi:hypothetical protein THASP1DRAFT_25900 [Thamnocephalis sphaerospora]|uniref:Uncharacterized protein n=1 Tax=Thamnocephalis sphaerospora TaxID=78915 RepID=A0A4P9XIT9_9FUNG|nr:hypothetical protein THASP1DRAFT_25900 [Thamnocephalis sphaerospora]|eukprot:RKP05634.1 hypothetical protein THASP1DRAFT_25900 [Thamnocephalis sphaerospora]
MLSMLDLVHRSATDNMRALQCSAPLPHICILLSVSDSVGGRCITLHLPTVVQYTIASVRGSFVHHYCWMIMPFWGDIDRNALLENDWEKNATHRLGIPLHPLGELNAIDYMMHANGDLPAMREQICGLFMQLFVNAVANYVFIRNLVISTTFGLAYTICALLYTMPGGPSCRQAVWDIGIGLTISPVCVSLILLQKAYALHRRSRLLLFAGIALLLPQPLVAYYLWSSPVIAIPATACLSFYPTYFPWIKLAMDAPINLMFSIAFITVIYRQYSILGSDAWARLVHSGIRTMCLVVISNIVCMLAAAFEILGPFSEMFLVLDWMATSWLLVDHCASTHSKETASHDLHTYNIMDEFLQIEAAASAHMPANTITADQARYSVGPRYLAHE